MSNLEKFRKWMSDQGESAIYIGDGKFEGYVANKMYDAFCGALAAPSIASSAPADELPPPFFYYESNADGSVEWNEGCVCIDDVYTNAEYAKENGTHGGKVYSEAQMRAAIAAQQAAPAARLVEALKQLSLAIDNVELPEGGLTGWRAVEIASASAAAALATIPVLDEPK